ncbi:MAG: AAA family ATPase [Aliihoeflea sp.]|uniref:AAA family ATPase n=1 Tax=Aliihoeflea sp. TaxID=2608088 RepID=UPI004034050B
MKTVTLRLARRLASLVELRDVQRAVINDAFGAYTWIDEVELDDVDLKLVATKRRKEAARRTTISAFHPGPPDVDPIAERQHRHGREHPVGRDVDIGELAVCLMLMPALRRLGARNLLAALHRVQPVIAVHGAVRGFERRFAGMLDEMLRVPRVKMRVLTIDSPNKLDASMRSLDTTLPIINIQSSAFSDAAPVALRKCLAKAMRERMPIVVTGDAPPVDLPARVTVVLDMTLQAAPLDWPMLAELIDAKTGIDAEPILNAVEAFPMDLAALSLDDLVMAIRPGHDLATILARLQVLAAASAAEPSEDEDDETKSKDGRSSGSTWRRNRNGTAGTGSTRIDPQPVPAEGDVSNPSGSDRAPAAPAAVAGEIHTVPAEVSGDVHTVPAAPNATGNARMDVGATEAAAETIAPAAANDQPARPPTKRPAPVATVETLAGYGEARSWALNLKTDLDLWHAGMVSWSDLSTKLLLSGPPGTGKTTFARALGNTLQLPVFATSVATWLEASHLGDVLGRMRDCFAEVQAARPCILFIDEIDGIGRRQERAREYADYWNAIVNKALELMDGALKTDGIIIVGATNRPNDIEPALRRSGRLETHIVIPKPDMHALESIIAFHLGDDLDRAAATMPSAEASAAEPAGDQDRRRDPSEPIESIGQQRGQTDAGNETPAQPGAASTGDNCSPSRKRKRPRASSETRAAAIDGPDQTVIVEGGVYAGQWDHPGKAGAREGTETSDGPAGEPSASTASERQTIRTLGARVSTRTFDPPGSSQTKPGVGDRQPTLRAHALRLLARTARGMTGADVERAIREERQRCRRARIAMSFDGVREALRGDRANHSDALRRQMAIHEAGHAVVARALKLGIQVDLTIDDPEGGQSRLAANMGDIQTEARMTDVLTMLLAGRAAEMVHGLQPLAGSGMIDGSDLQIATRLALDLECRGGFSDRTPLLYVDPASTNALYSARPDAYQRANTRLEDALARATRLIDWARPAHAALTEQLLVYGTLDGAEVDAILGPIMDEG